MDKSEQDPNDGGADEDDDNDEGVVHLGYVESIQDMQHLEQVAFRSPNYNEWDGGQLGGCPNWLDPQHIPQGPLLCTRYPQEHGSLSFVCQIYAPVDKADLHCTATTKQDDTDETTEERAFHRALYVFACAKCCIGDNMKEDDNQQNKPGSENSATLSAPCVRVLRGQLPQENPYYPLDPKLLSSNELDNWTSHETVPCIHLCQVCGLRAIYQCPLQKLYFCCKEHQKEYYLNVFQPLQKQEEQSIATTMVRELPSLYPIAEIVVEEEHDDTDKHGSPSPSTPVFASSNDGSDDEDLEQDDLNQMVRGSKKGGVTDPVTMAFLERCRSNPDQVLRYQRWPSVDNKSAIQWFRQEQQPTSNIPPPCELCGAPRKFEFQLMPQMLHYLLKRKPQSSLTTEAEFDDGAKERELQAAWNQAMQVADSWMEQAPPEQVPPCLVEAKDTASQRYQQGKFYDSTTAANNLDFGVVAIYTCTASCDLVCGSSNGLNPSLGAYREEYAWVQTSL